MSCLERGLMIVVYTMTLDLIVQRGSVSILLLVQKKLANEAEGH